ncbi:MAG: hypothetical protein ABI851_03360 [Saprospiraceae bacterium]
MKSFFLLMLFTCFSIASSLGQIQAKWIGGYPGRSKDWNCAMNWSNNKVPNEFTDVSIPSFEYCYMNYPELYLGVKEVRSLELGNYARLKISTNSQLIVHKKASQELNLNRIEIKGRLIIKYHDPYVFATH